jgi:hypothetical protein
MAKDINIHLKTKGAAQTKQQLGEVGQSAKKVGDTTEEMGTKAKRGGGGVVSALKKLVGPIGFMAIASAVAAAAAKVGKFFDNIKARTDEAVRDVQDLRKAYTDLFEALDAFDEKSRQAVTKATNLLLQETGVTEEIGLPVIDAYTRQFKALVDAGQITQEQYDRGLKETLGYAERHGGGATKDLVAIMSGWGMVTPEEQGEFRRMIAAGAQQVGLTDEDVIEALGRGMPTIKAMGWSPQQAIETITTIAAGEVGRKKKSLPATTLQALMQPQLTKIEEYGISEEAAKDPKLLLEQLQKKRADMDQKAFTRMLVDIYGGESAAGVSKLLTAPRHGIGEVLRQAASEAGAEAERAEEEGRRGTLEARDAAGKARERQIELELTIEEQYMEDVRGIGWKRQKRLRINEPIRQEYREFFQYKVEEKEYAAYRDWVDRLTDEELAEVRRKYGTRGRARGYDPERIAWYEMSAKEKYEALVRTRPTETSEHTRPKPEQPRPVQPERKTQVELEPSAKQVSVPVEAEQAPTVVNHYHYTYDYGIRYFPRVGSDESGPRIEPGAVA